MLIVDSHRCWELRGFFRTTSGRTVAKHATSVFFFANISKNTKQTGNWLATPKSENSQAKSPKSPKKRCHGDRHWTSWHGQFAGHFGLWHSAREGRSTARLLGTCLVRGQLSNWGPKIRWMGQRNLAPAENGGKHPIIYRVSTCFNHPFGAGFRWPIGPSTGFWYFWSNWSNWVIWQPQLLSAGALAIEPEKKTDENSSKCYFSQKMGGDSPAKSLRIWEC